MKKDNDLFLGMKDIAITMSHEKANLELTKRCRDSLYELCD